MSWAEFKTFGIKVENREDFNKILDWDLETFNITDIGHSDMIFKFSTEEDRDELAGCVIWNHIPMEDVE